MTAGTLEQVRKFIDETEVFGELPPDARDDLAKSAKVQTHQADEMVFKRGDTGDSLFFVLSGEVRIILQLPKGEEEVSHMKRGDFFGEIALMTQSRRTATVTAVTESTLVEFEGPAVKPLIEKYPKFKANIARAGAQRSTEALGRMIEE